MRNAGWKRLLAMVLVLMMTLSLMPAAFADGDEACTLTEGCTLTAGHEGACVLQEKEDEDKDEDEVGACTLTEGCTLTAGHEGACVLQEKEDEGEDEDEVGACTLTEGCSLAAGHEGACVLKEKEDGGEACTLTEGCTLAAGHEGECVLKEKEDEGEACTLTEGCTLAAGHEGACVLQEKEDGGEACTLTEGCTLAAGHAGECVLKEKEDEGEEPSAAVQAFLDAVAAIVIPENPEEMDEDSVAALEAQLEAANDAYEALSEEELEREDVLAACAVMSAALDLLYGERTTWRTYDSVPLNLTVSSYGAPFLNGNTGEHSVSTYKLTKYIKRTEACGSGSNASGSATARFIGSNESGWTLVIDITVGNYSETVTTNAKVTNKDMSNATGTITFGMSWNTQGGVSTTVRISGAQNLPAPTYSYKVQHVYRTNGVQDGTDTETISNVPSGTTVQLNSIPKKPEYNGNTYTYTSGTLASATISNNSTVFTLYYDRTKAPTTTEVEDLLANNAVTVECVNTDADHEERTYGLLAGSYSIGEVVADAEAGYVCTITVYADLYVAAYNSGVASGHVLNDGELESRYIHLKYSDTESKWVRANLLHPSFEVKCEDAEITPPDKPADDDVSDILGNAAVKIDCVNTDVSHEDKTYGLIDGSFTVGDAEENDAGGYTCTVTIQAAEYVTQYNTDTGVTHELDPENQTSKTVTLEYDADSETWTAASGAAPVTFTVKCVTPPAPTGKPDAPNESKLEETLTNEVVVQCVNNSATHEKVKTYDLLTGSYDIGEVTGDATSGYFCEITVSAAPYVNKYNSDVASGHSLVTGDPNSQKFTLKYKADDSSWYRPNPDGPAATFTVECEGEEITPPAKPTDDTVSGLLGETAVKVDCVNANVSHADETYGLLDGSFTVGAVEGNDADGYTCTVTIQADPYVTAYNSAVASGHSLATDETPSKTVTLTYDADNEEWTVPANAVPVVFRVVCSASQPATDWRKLTITKTVSPTGTVMPGDTVTYTITVTNNTGKLLYGITVADVLDSKLELINARADKGSYDFTNGIWSFPTGMAVFTDGSSATLTITAKVKADATGTINNTATITGAQDGGNGLPQGSGGSSSVSIKVGTPAPMKKFTLSYNANGGKGAPSSQSVETTANSVVMTVSSVKPTRDGYHFCGWALTPNGHVSYRPGNEITLTGDVTLYAVWATRTGSPQTGDSSNIALWAAMAGMSLVAGAVVLLVLKKRKAE